MITLGTMIRGQTRVYQFELQLEGNPLNLDALRVIFTAKRRFRDSDSLAIIRKSTDTSSEITVTDVESGLIEVNIAPGDTTPLRNRPQMLYWDLKVIDISDTTKQWPALRGVLPIDPAVTVGVS